MADAPRVQFFPWRLIEVVVIGCTWIDLVIDAVQPGRQHCGTSQVGIRGRIHHAIFNAARAGDPDHLGTVRTAIGDVNRRPGCAGTRSSADETLVAVYRWSQNGT